MKEVFIVVALFFVFNSFGQQTNVKNNNASSQIYRYSSGDATIQNSDGTSSQIYRYSNGDATIQNSDGTSSQIYQYSNGDATIQNSDGTSSQIYQYSNGDATIQNSDGTSSQIYQYGNGDATIQHSGVSTSQIYEYSSGDATIQNTGSLKLNSTNNFSSKESENNESNNAKIGAFGNIISSSFNSSNQNKSSTDVHGISDDTYDALGNAAGQLAAILLIRKAEKKYEKAVKEYNKKPSIETAFEIEKYSSRALNLKNNTGKMINSASFDENFESNFSGSTSIPSKWGPISDEHKSIIEKFGNYRKYKKSLK